MSKRIAYLNCRSYRGKPVPPDNVPPLERVSRDLIVAAGAAHGLRFELRYWDDPALPEGGYDAALIRTCWDYHERLDTFIGTLAAYERAGLPVFNSSEVVRWNARKTYLRDLGEAAIETIWVDSVTAENVTAAFEALRVNDIVVKPQIGAGARDTVRLKRGAWLEADLTRGPKGAAMIQPFLNAIETEGERSLIWFGGAYSHGVRKAPAPGAWLANVPGETRFSAERPPPAALDVAEAARACAPRDLLYVRIDLVLGNDGRWRVIEIEAIEPYLFLDFAPEGAGALVRAMSRVLSG